MKIHVHLGTHKTATTFIQGQLKNSMPALAAERIGYTHIQTIRKNFTKPFNQLLWLPPLAAPLVRPFLARKLESVLTNQNDCTRYILSDENLLGLIFSNYWSGKLYPNADVRVRLLDKILSDHDVHYFITIRRYPNYLTSSWLQLSSRGRAPSFEKYLAKFSPDDRGWAELVSDIANVCGPERLTVWTYDWFNENQSRVFPLLAPGVQISLPERQPQRDVLPSLTIKGLKVMQTLEGQVSKSELKEFSRLLRKFPFDEPNPRLEITDEKLLAAYEQKYRDDLIRIRELGVDLHCEQIAST